MSFGTTADATHCYQKTVTYHTTYRYEAGSTPLDLYHASFMRGQKDFKELLSEHGGKLNPKVDNEKR